MAEPAAEQALTRRDRSQAALVEAAAGLAQDVLDARPAPDAWSIGEVLPHIVLVESALLSVISRLADRAPDTRRPGGLAGATLPLQQLADGRARARDTSGRLFPQPFLGRLDSCQWALFLAEHAPGHTAQARAIVAKLQALGQL
jgi:hypothetical protein